ncbi:MAG: hypothetical protein WBE41_08130 [Terracidiphilus sp.]
MAAWLLWFLPSFEAGFWSALVAGKLRGRGRTRELLVYGGPARICLPLIDERLRKAAGTPTKSQAFASRRIAAGLRWLANTRAMDYAILLGLRRIWPKGQTISTEVKMCL